MVKKQIEPLTQEEMQRLMEIIERSDEFDYMLFFTLKTTGRRIGELYGIEEKEKIGRKVTSWKEFRYKGNRVRVPERERAISKKTGKWKFGVQLKDIDFVQGIMKVWVLKRREYYQDESILTPELSRTIQRYAKRYRLKLDDYVFRKQGRSYRQIENKIKTYAKKAGITKNVVPHNFRHNFVTQLKRMGYSEDKIKKLTGHKSVSSLSAYDHVLPSELKEEVMGDLRRL
jgi:integrase